MATTMQDGRALIARGPSLVRWGAIFAGAVSGLAIFALLTAMWVALSYNNIGGGVGPNNVNVEFIENNLEWFIAGSGAFALLAGGFITGWFVGLRGGGIGALNGLVGWAVTVVAGVIFGIPSVFGAFAGFGDTTGNNVLLTGLWAPFWTFLGGLVLGVLGGALGGVTKRPTWLFEPQAVDVTEVIEQERGGYVMRPMSVNIRETSMSRQ